MNKKLKTILLTTLLGASALSAQSLYHPDQPFKTIFGSGRKVSSYYTGSNPAYLQYDGGTRLLSLQTVYNQDKGEFRRFIDPEASSFYQVSASGKKNIDSSQLFKGSFGFQRIERDGWRWLQTRDYTNFSPFLLGDSTTGRTHYNGIVMNAEYGAELWGSLLAGFSINYNVDESLKEVFPRPTGDHRDVDIRLGLGYLINKNYSAGLSVKITDNLEKIKYANDEGGVSREVSLLKFRGYEFPFVNKLKTETRSGYTNGFYSYANFSYTGSMMKLAAFFGGGLEQLSIKDDAINPVNQGYWKNKPYEGALQAAINAPGNLLLGVAYNIRIDDMWAKHAAGSVLLMENKMTHHAVTMGIEYPASSGITLGAEGGFISDEIKYFDYYSALNWQKKGTAVTASAGAEVTWSDIISTFISYSIYKNTLKDTNTGLFTGRFSESPAPYPSAGRRMDIAFLLSEFTMHSVSSVISVEPAKWGSVILYLSYSTADPEEGMFSGKHRNSFNSAIELRIKAY